MKDWLKYIAPYTQRTGALVQVVLCLLVAIGLWSFAGKRQRSRVVNKVNISIENSVENHFVDAEEIESIIGKGQNNEVYMRWFDSISLRRIEKRIEKIDFVKHAQASHDLEGNIFIQVKLVKPIARIVNGGSDADRYLGAEGEILPTSEKYVAKVLTVDGPGSRKLLYRHPTSDSNTVHFLETVQFIQGHKFWKSQISHISISEDNELTLYPEVGQQTIEFGPGTEIEKKFQKLDAFYQKIIPVKGWNTYKRVSVKYKNQIVCQKSS